MTISQETLKAWQDLAKRDDAWAFFVPSDIRQMLGEIDRLREALRRVDHTLTVHGKVDADTPLHEFVSDALG